MMSVSNRMCLDKYKTNWFVLKFSKFLAKHKVVCILTVFISIKVNILKLL